MNWTFHHKRLNVYLSLLMILMMMGETSVEGFAAYGLNDTVYAASKGSKGGKGSSKGGKSRRKGTTKARKAKGQAESDDRNGASHWKLQLGDKAVGDRDINDATLRKLDGYLKATPKKMSVSVFGGSGSSGGYEKQGHFWNRGSGFGYEKQFDGSDNGKVGAVWKNAYVYYDLKHQKKPVPITIKATLIGHSTAVYTDEDRAKQHAWQWHPSKAALNQLVFSKKSVGIQAFGTGNDIFQFQLYAKGVPFRKSVMFNIKDIDVDQHIAIKDLKHKLMKRSAIYHQPETWVNVEPTSHRRNWDFTGRGQYTNASGGSVATGDPRGWASFILDPNMTIAYARGAGASQLLDTDTHHQASNKLPSKTTTVNAKHGVTTSDHGVVDGNYFGFDAREKLPQPPTIDQYKDIGKTEDEAMFKQKHDLGTIKADTPFYYGLHTIVNWPAGAYASGKNFDENAIKKLNFVDNLPKGLQIVGKAKVYKFDYMSADGNQHGKKTDVTGLFTDKSEPSKGKLDLELSAAGRKSNSKIFDGHIVAVFKVKASKDAPFTERDGQKIYGEFDNKFAIIDGSKTTGQGGKVKIWKTPDKENMPKPDASKWVYKKTPGTNSWDKGHDINGATVNPNQALAYRLKFHLPSPPSNTDTKKYRYDKLEIKDKLDSKLEVRGNDSSSIKASVGDPDGGDNAGCQISNGMVIVKWTRPENAAKLDQLKGGGDVYVNFTVHVKGYKPSDGDKIVNQGSISATIGKNKRDQFEVPITDKDGNVTDYQTVYGDWNYQDSDPTWDSYKTVTATTNKTVNPLEENPPHVTKEAWSQNPDGKMTPGTTSIEYGDTMQFRISTRVGKINGDVGAHYSVLKLSDDFNEGSAENLQIKSAKVYKSMDGTVDEDGNPGSYFTNATISGRHVEWNANCKSLDMKGETYTLVIEVKYDRTATETYKDDDPTFHNKGHWEIGTKGDVSSGATNQVDVDVEKNESSISKSVDKIVDTYNGQEIPLGNIMDPRDNHDVTFTLSAILGNTHKSATLSDTLPENMTIIPSSIKTVVKKDKGYDNYENGGGTVKPTVTKSQTAGGDTVDTISANIDQQNVEVDVTFTAHLSGESDWSDYYNQNGGEVHYNNGLNYVNDASYIGIKNYDNLKFDDGKIISGFASFNMGCQPFHTEQFIVQDDNKWTKHLDPSHYNPVKAAKVRNNKTAVTTAIKLVMPNYLKIDGLDIENKNLTPGFDKGWATVRRANLKLVHGDISALPNYDLGGDENLDGKGISAPKSDWHEPDNPPRFNEKGVESYSNLQEASETSFGQSGDVATASDGAGQPIAADKSTDGTSSTDYAGKTYYHIQKWNPKTRYYHDYAKLGDMETGFEGTVHLFAHAAGERSVNDTASGQTYHGSESIDHTYSKKDELNDVGIHLSNIYGYTTLSDKATYSQDGKTVKYKTYGQFLGLAVDKRNKTQFMDPGKPGSYDDKKLKPESQPIEAYIGNNTNVLKMKSNLGTGEESIIENTSSSPAPNNDKDYASGYKGNDTYKVVDHNTKKDDNAQWNNLDITQFWKLTDLDSPHCHWVARPVEHGYTSDSDLTETKGHSVTITIPRVDHDETLTKTRQALIKYDPYKKIVFTTKPDVYNVSYKNHFEVKQVGENQEATNPKKFITYFDFNRDWSHDAKPVQRVLLEAYEFSGPNSITAKSGYGIQENHKLSTFTYHNDMSRSRLLDDYRTNMSSKDGIFDPGYTKTANDEALSMSYNVLRRDNEINRNLQTDQNSNGDLLSLLGGRQFFIRGVGNENEYEITRAREDWRPILPNYRLTVMSYRFNNRVLKDGKQAYAKSDVDYPDYNTNIGGFNYTDSDVTRGGFRDYIKNDIGEGTYPLNWRTTTNNKGLLGDIGFGIGYATSIDFTQQLRINGSRYLTEKGPRGLDNSNTAETAIDPVISGREAQKINGFSDKQNDFIKDNDSGTLSKYNK